MTDVPPVALVALWMLVLVEAFFIAAILRQLRQVQTRLPRLFAKIAVGAVAPDFTLPDTTGQRVHLQAELDAMQAEWLVLLFISPACFLCRHLLASIADRLSRHVALGGGFAASAAVAAPHDQQSAAASESAADELQGPEFELLILSDGGTADTAATVQGIALPRAPIVGRGSRALRDYGVAVSPYMLVIDRRRRVRAAGGADTVEGLVRLVRMAARSPDRLSAAAHTARTEHSLVGAR